MTAGSSMHPDEGLAGTSGFGGAEGSYQDSESAPARQRRGQPGASLDDEGWWSVAACRYADPDLFFPVSAAGKSLQQVTEAKAICAGCPARAECLAFALRTKQMYGVWGGMTEEERYQAANHPIK